MNHIELEEIRVKIHLVRLLMIPRMRVMKQKSPLPLLIYGDLLKLVDQQPGILLI